MNYQKYIIYNWKKQAILLLIMSFVIGLAAERYTQYSFFQVIAGVNAIGGIVVIVHQLSNDQSSASTRTPEERDNNPNTETTDSDPGTKDGSSRSRTPPSKGLTAEEQSIQNEMIRRAYQGFYENPVTTFINRQPMIGNLSEDLDIDRDTVHKVWQVTVDDGFFHKRQNTWEMTPKAVDRSKELGEDVLLDEDIQNEVLDLLLQKYRENPRHPVVERDTLISALDCSDNEVDHNIWLLEKKGFAETKAYLNSSSTYSEVKITQLGRRVTE